MLQGLGLFVFVVGGCFILTGAAIIGFGLGYVGARLIISAE